MELTESKLVPHWSFMAVFLIFTAIGVHLTAFYSVHGAVMFIWAIWVLGIGYEKQKRDNPDVVMEG